MFSNILDYIRSDLYHTLTKRHPRDDVSHGGLMLTQTTDGISLGRRGWFRDDDIEENLPKANAGGATPFDHHWITPDRENYQMFILGLDQDELPISPEDVPDIIGFESEFGIRQHQIEGLIQTHPDGCPSVEVHNLYLYWGYWKGEIEHKGVFRKKFVCHRENGPARVYLSKLKKWHQKGKLYREDEPIITCDRLHALWMHHGEIIEADQERPQSVAVSNFSETMNPRRGLSLTQARTQKASLNYIWRMNQRTYHTKVLQPIFDDLSKRGLSFNLLSTGSVFGSNVDRMAFYAELSKHVR